MTIQVVNQPTVQPDNLNHFLQNYPSRSVCQVCKNKFMKSITDTELTDSSMLTLLPHHLTATTARRIGNLRETRLSPTRWNVKHTLPQRFGDSRVWWQNRHVQPWRLTPHTLLHNTTHPFFIPLPRMPFFKCVSS